MTPTYQALFRQALSRLLIICHEAACREDDTDTATECLDVTTLLAQGHSDAEAKALTIIEAHVAVMNDQLKEQGL